MGSPQRHFHWWRFVGVDVCPFLRQKCWNRRGHLVANIPGVSRGTHPVKIIRSRAFPRRINAIIPFEILHVIGKGRVYVLCFPSAPRNTKNHLNMPRYRPPRNPIKNKTGSRRRCVIKPGRPTRPRYTGCINLIRQVAAPRAPFMGTGTAFGYRNLTAGSTCRRPGRRLKRWVLYKAVTTYSTIGGEGASGRPYTTNFDARHKIDDRTDRFANLRLISRRIGGVLCCAKINRERRGQWTSARAQDGVQWVIRLLSSRTKGASWIAESKKRFVSPRREPNCWRFLVASFCFVEISLEKIIFCGVQLRDGACKIIYCLLLFPNFSPSMDVSNFWPTKSL